MDKTGKYRPTDKMSDLICGNYTLLQVLSRFGISLGFGDRNVREVCEMNNVDYRTFLEVVNFVVEDSPCMHDHLEDISVPALVNYLKNAHSYFLDFQLPNLRKKMVESLSFSTDKEVTFLILQFFDAYVDEVKKHMEYENEMVFDYVDKLIEGIRTDDYSISVFASHHDHIDTKMKELKNIIIKYLPSGGDDRMLNSTLFDIFICEQDLVTHNSIEDYLFVPAIMELEKEVK